MNWLSKHIFSQTKQQFIALITFFCFTTTNVLFVTPLAAQPLPPKPTRTLQTPSAMAELSEAASRISNASWFRDTRNQALLKPIWGWMFDRNTPLLREQEAELKEQMNLALSNQTLSQDAFEDTMVITLRRAFFHWIENRVRFDYEVESIQQWMSTLPVAVRSHPKIGSVLLYAQHLLQSHSTKPEVTIDQANVDHETIHISTMMNQMIDGFDQLAQEATHINSILHAVNQEICQPGQKQFQKLQVLWKNHENKQNSIHAPESVRFPKQPQKELNQEEIEKLKAYLGNSYVARKSSPLPNSPSTGPDAETLQWLYPNGYDPNYLHPGGHQAAYQDRLKQIIKQTKEKSIPLQSVLAYSSFGPLLNTATPLSKYVGQFDENRCIQQGKTYQLIPILGNRAPDAQNLIHASIQTLSQTHQETIQGILEHWLSIKTKDQYQKHLKDFIQYHPESVHYMLLKYPSQDRLLLIASLIQQITILQYMKDDFAIPMANAFASLLIFLKPLTMVLGSLYFVKEGWDTWKESSHAIEELNQSLSIYNIDPVWGKELLHQAQQQQRYSAMQMAIAGIATGVGVYLRNVQINKMKQQTKLIDAQGGSTFSTMDRLQKATPPQGGRTPHPHAKTQGIKIEKPIVEPPTNPPVGHAVAPKTPPGPTQPSQTLKKQPLSLADRTPQTLSSDRFSSTPLEKLKTRFEMIAPVQQHSVKPLPLAWVVDPLTYIQTKKQEMYPTGDLPIWIGEVLSEQDKKYIQEIIRKINTKEENQLTPREKAKQVLLGQRMFSEDLANAIREILAGEEGRTWQKVAQEWLERIQKLQREAPFIQAYIYAYIQALDERVKQSEKHLESLLKSKILTQEETISQLKHLNRIHHNKELLENEKIEQLIRWIENELNQKGLSKELIEKIFTSLKKLSIDQLKVNLNTYETLYNLFGFYLGWVPPFTLFYQFDLDLKSFDLETIATKYFHPFYQFEKTDLIKWIDEFKFKKALFVVKGYLPFELEDLPLIGMIAIVGYPKNQNKSEALSFLKDYFQDFQYENQLPSFLENIENHYVKNELLTRSPYNKLADLSIEQPQLVQVLKSRSWPEKEFSIIEASLKSKKSFLALGYNSNMELTDNDYLSTPHSTIISPKEIEQSLFFSNLGNSNFVRWYRFLNPDSNEIEFLKSYLSNNKPIQEPTRTEKNIFPLEFSNHPLTLKGLQFLEQGIPIDYRRVVMNNWISQLSGKYLEGFDTFKKIIKKHNLEPDQIKDLYTLMYVIHRANKSILRQHSFEQLEASNKNKILMNLAAFTHYLTHALGFHPDDAKKATKTLADSGVLGESFAEPTNPVSNPTHKYSRSTYVSMIGTLDTDKERDLYNYISKPQVMRQLLDSLQSESNTRTQYLRKIQIDGKSLYIKGHPNPKDMQEHLNATKLEYFCYKIARAWFGFQSKTEATSFLDNNPNIIPIYLLLEIHGVPYLVYEAPSKETLFSYLDHFGNQHNSLTLHQFSDLYMRDSAHLNLQNPPVPVRFNLPDEVLFLDLLLSAFDRGWDNNVALHLDNPPPLYRYRDLPTPLLAKPHEIHIFDANMALNLRLIDILNISYIHKVIQTHYAHPVEIKNAHQWVADLFKKDPKYLEFLNAFSLDNLDNQTKNYVTKEQLKVLQSNIRILISLILEYTDIVEITDPLHLIHQSSSQHSKADKTTSEILNKINENENLLQSALAYFFENEQFSATQTDTVHDFFHFISFKRIKDPTFKNQLIQFMYIVHLQEQDKGFYLRLLIQYLNKELPKHLDSESIDLSHRIRNWIHRLAKENILGLTEQDFQDKILARQALRGKALSTFSGPDQAIITKWIHYWYQFGNDLEKELAQKYIHENVRISKPHSLSKDPTHPIYHAEKLLEEYQEGKSSLSITSIVHKAVATISENQSHPYSTIATSFLAQPNLAIERVQSKATITNTSTPTKSNPIPWSLDFQIDAIQMWNDYALDFEAEKFRQWVGNSCWNNLIKIGSIPLVTSSLSSYKQVFSLCGKSLGWADTYQLFDATRATLSKGNLGSKDNWYKLFFQNIYVPLENHSFAYITNDQDSFYVPTQYVDFFNKINLLPLEEATHYLQNLSTQSILLQLKKPNGVLTNEILITSQNKIINELFQAIGKSRLSDEALRELSLFIYGVHTLSETNTIEKTKHLVFFRRFLINAFKFNKVQASHIVDLMARSYILGKKPKKEQSTGPFISEELQRYYKELFEQLDSKQKRNVVNFISEATPDNFSKLSQIELQAVCYHSISSSGSFGRKAILAIDDYGISCYHFNFERTTEQEPKQTLISIIDVDTRAWIGKINKGDLDLALQTYHYIYDDLLFKPEFIPYILHYSGFENHVAGNARLWMEKNFKIMAEVNHVIELIRDTNGNTLQTMEDKNWILLFSTLDNDLGFLSRQWLINQKDFVQKTLQKAKAENISKGLEIYLVELLRSSAEISQSQVQAWLEHMGSNPKDWNAILKILRPLLEDCEEKELTRLMTYVHFIPIATIEKKKALRALEHYFETAFEPHQQDSTFLMIHLRNMMDNGNLGLKDLAKKIKKAEVFLDNQQSKLTQEILDGIVLIRNLDEEHPQARKARRFLGVASISQSHPNLLKPVTYLQPFPKRRTQIENTLRKIGKWSTKPLSDQQTRKISETLANHFVFNQSLGYEDVSMDYFNISSTLSLSPRKSLIDWPFDLQFYFIWDEQGTPYFFFYDRSPSFSYKSNIFPLERLNDLPGLVDIEHYDRSWDKILKQKYHFYRYDSYTGGWKKVSFNDHVREITKEPVPFSTSSTEIQLQKDASDQTEGGIDAGVQRIIQGKLDDPKDVLDQILNNLSSSIDFNENLLMAMKDLWTNPKQDLELHGKLVFWLEQHANAQSFVYIQMEEYVNEVLVSGLHNPTPGQRFILQLLAEVLNPGDPETKRLAHQWLATHAQNHQSSPPLALLPSLFQSEQHKASALANEYMMSFLASADGDPIVLVKHIQAQSVSLTYSETKEFIKKWNQAILKGSSAVKFLLGTIHFERLKKSNLHDFFIRGPESYQMVANIVPKKLVPLQDIETNPDFVSSSQDPSKRWEAFLEDRIETTTWLEKAIQSDRLILDFFDRDLMAMKRILQSKDHPMQYSLESWLKTHFLTRSQIYEMIKDRVEPILFSPESETMGEYILIQWLGDYATYRPALDWIANRKNKQHTIHSFFNEIIDHQNSNTLKNPTTKSIELDNHLLIFEVNQFNKVCLREKSVLSNQEFKFCFEFSIDHNDEYSFTGATIKLITHKNHIQFNHSRFLTAKNLYDFRIRFAEKISRGRIKNFHSLWVSGLEYSLNRNYFEFIDYFEKTGDLMGAAKQTTDAKEFKRLGYEISHVSTDNYLKPIEVIHVTYQKSKRL